VSGSPKKGSSSTLGMGVSRDPEGGVIKTSNIRYNQTHKFIGHTLTKTMMFESGARRVTVNFDENFRTCRLMLCMEGERHSGVVVHGMNTRLMVMQVKVSGQNCTITDGNMFGGNSD
jgi:hypothetical protein